MIPVFNPSLDSKESDSLNYSSLTWQQKMAMSLRSVGDLLDYLSISPERLPYQIDSSQAFATRITREFADLIDVKNPMDPILLQILPRTDEQISKPHLTLDPLKETHFSPMPGLIHKYKNRVLLIAHQSCAVHCRYCFRRHFPYDQQRLDPASLSTALSYINRQPEINEVILSGGDPLSLNDEKLGNLINEIEIIAHIKTLRIHTRSPVVLPDRLTGDFFKILQNRRLKIVIVFHINHPNEISTEFKTKVTELKKQTDAILLNQAVLLKDINDKASIQITLCESLFQAGILPYYLHQLDPVMGADHFNITNECAIRVWKDMQASLSGYILPRLVKEIPDKPSKTWITSAL